MTEVIARRGTGAAVVAGAVLDGTVPAGSEAAAVAGAAGAAGAADATVGPPVRVDSSAGTLIARSPSPGRSNGAPAAMAEGSNSRDLAGRVGQRDDQRHDTDDRRDEHDDTGATTSPRRAVPHRILDQPERRIREHDRHGDAYTEQRHPVEPRPVRTEHDIDRPMPQVQPVRQHTDPRQRPPAEPAHEPAPISGDDQRDHHGTRERMGEQTTPVEHPRTRTLDGDPRPPDQCSQQDHHDTDAIPRRRHHTPCNPAHRFRRGERTDEQRSGPCVGAHVDPRRLDTVVEQHHRHERQTDRDTRADHERADRSARPPPDRHDDERPHEIELLLDRQAPEVVEHRRFGERLPVPTGLRDEVPVGDVEHGPRTIAFDTRQVRQAAEQPRPQSDDHDQRQHRRQQSTEPSTPERSETHTTRGVGVADQQRRDEKPRKGEEQINTEKPALQVPTVEQQHRHHGQRAQTIERRDVPPRRRDRSARRARHGARMQ